MYRSAEGPGSAIGGVPLSSAEDAVVAAVRMGYRVAQTQVDRAERFTERLRGAGDRAVGPEPERQAVDATEMLVSKALLTGLEWLEGVAAEPGSPLRRYATAQYKLLGAMLGLQAGKEDASGAAAAPRPKPEPRAVRVMHRGGARRPVRVRVLHLDQHDADEEIELQFYCAADLESAPLEATVALMRGQPAVLHIKTVARSPAGLWKAALCANSGEQLGWIEIEL